MLYISSGLVGRKAMSGELSPEEDTSGAKVLLINMRSHQSDLLDQAQRSNVNRRRFFLDILHCNEDLHRPGVPSFDVMQLEKLKLSADHTHEDWIELAQLIKKEYHHYRGFVVESGSDNMVTTSTAVSFLLENLGKPVIFTGSLIPGHRIYTDMTRNIILALAFASCSQICDVCILFDEMLYRANRTIKMSRCSLRPFDSPHFPPIASMRGGVLIIRKVLLRPHPTGRLRIEAELSTKVLTLELGPGAPFEFFRAAIEYTSAPALILRCYGSGNGPTRRDFMKRLLAIAKTRDLVVVICTHNRYGVVALSEYEAGRQLMGAGAISAGDMTHEAAMVKLKYLFGLGMSPEQVRKYFAVDMRGEVSSPSAKL
ncbi:asparaginase-like protein [Leishmania donovani]|uniref:asparaginase n=3 Tax=Leishmania donovani species complex TaxID=38574 RepID=A0A6L0XSE2_LEIIN|nr:asparaginase-like protein [Leishmania infantum JPCM5]XP_003865579.1 asparaginase-like protein [Leishmania donovani]CAC9551874.1 asparaginase-like_protein [Leishmania infantum]AYU83820.1 asparaginase-like protein [Leishmania donovani]TPP42000.1 Asparaginase family protein [Leishmania donovani]TPP48570.1 Asparaginase family protein [Leishmania donovani]CAJ1993838.1 asparaginase-like protein [Leishmania donovani]|eukprot:XP_001469841.1 asparaginase-like protein [Leishmania infantum JPCM5]